MCKIKILFLFLILLSVSEIAYAEGYSYNFDDLNPGLYSNATWAPTGWARKCSSTDYLAAGNNFMGSWNDTYLSYGVKPGGITGCYVDAPLNHQLTSNSFGPSIVSYDCLVSPAVGGCVKFKAMTTNTFSSSVKLEVYMCRKLDDGSFDFDDSQPLYVIGKSDLSSSWAEFTIDNIPDGSYLGFCMYAVGIDDFSATKANFGEVADIKSLVINSTSLENENMRLVENDENQISVPCTFVLSNAGNVDLSSKDENYTITLFNVDTEEDVCTVALPEDILAGETREMSVNFVFVANAKARYSIRENITKSIYSCNVWIDPVPNVPKAEFSGIPDLLTKGIAYGIVNGSEVSNTFTVISAGGAPLVITSVNIPECYEIYPNNWPITVESENSIEFKLTLKADMPGNKAGIAKFKMTDLDDVNIPLRGFVVSQDKYFEDFESSATIPSGWIVSGTNYRVGESPLVSDQCGVGNVLCNENAKIVEFITPKLHFEEGEIFSFWASRRDDSSYIEVWTSIDRSNWFKQRTLAAEYATPDVDKLTDLVDGPYSFSYALTPFDTPMSSGDYYIKFVTYYVYIDNIYGGKIVPQTTDFYIKNSSLPSEGMVNTPVALTADFQNLAVDEAVAGSYQVSLLINNEIFETITDTQSVLSGEVKSYTFNYTPHDAGSVSIQILLTADDGYYTLSTPLAKIEVVEEVPTTLYAVGNRVIDNYSSLPLSILYCNSASQTLYPASLINLDPGTAINKIEYRGKFTDANPITMPQVKVWMYETTQSVDKSNPVELTDELLVYSGRIVAFESSQIKPDEDILLSFNLAKPYIYNGGDLLIAVESQNQSGYKTVRFVGGDAKADNVSAIFKQHDDNDNFQILAYNDHLYYPIVDLGLVSKCAIFSGIVKDKRGVAIEGAEIELVSDNVLYKTVSDEKGGFSVNIMQVSRDYLFSVSASGYDIYRSEELVSFADGDVIRNVELECGMPEQIVLSGVVSASEMPIIGQEVLLLADDMENVVSVTNADGEYRFVITDFSKVYSLSVDNANYPVYIQQIELGTDDVQTNNIVLQPFGNDACYTLKMTVTSDNNESLVGKSFKLVNGDYVYPEDETVLNEFGACLMNVRGGKHTLIFDIEGMNPYCQEFSWNKDVEININLTSALYQVTFNLVANNHENIDGHELILNSEKGVCYHDVVVDGCVTFYSLPADTYNINYTIQGYKTLEQSVTITENCTIELSLIEQTPPPGECELGGIITEMSDEDNDGFWILELKWTPPTDCGIHVRGYKVTVDGEEIALIDDPETNTTNINNVEWGYRVIGICAVYTSSDSEYISEGVMLEEPDPNSVEDLSEEVSTVWGKVGAAVVKSADMQKIIVTDLNGNVYVDYVIQPGYSVIELPAGVYIVAIENKRLKVIVK